MKSKKTIETQRKETQNDLKSALRRQLKLQQKIDRLKAKLLDLRDQELGLEILDPEGEVKSQIETAKEAVQKKFYEESNGVGSDPPFEMGDR